MNSQYSVAVHVLTLIDAAAGQISSEDIAGSVGVNPVVIRSVTGLLRRAGLLTTKRGVLGAQLTRLSSQITLLEVYRAVLAPETVIKMHQHPNPACPVGAHIQGVLSVVFAEAQAALEARLAQVRLCDISAAVHLQTG